MSLINQSHWRWLEGTGFDGLCLENFVIPITKHLKMFSKKKKKNFIVKNFTFETFYSETNKALI